MNKVSWKILPYWVKGGLILSLVHLISVIFLAVKVRQSVGFDISFFWILIFGFLVFPSLVLLDSDFVYSHIPGGGMPGVSLNDYVIGIIAAEAVSLIIVFLIGAILGSIWGWARKRK